MHRFNRTLTFAEEIGFRTSALSPLIPAKAGIHVGAAIWIPAFAGRSG